MTVIAILGVVTAIAAPSMSDFLDKRKIINVAEAVYSEFQYARSEAISRSQDVFASVSSDGSTTWSLGVSTTSNCDPTQATITAADACVLVIDDGDGNVHDGVLVVDNDDLVRRVINSTNFPGIVMGNLDDPIAAVSFAGGGSTQAQFDSTRGVVNGGGGTVVLRLEASDGRIYEMRVILSGIGRVRLCTPPVNGVGGYSEC
jgi:Tfp pilus assembly protein FimT